MTGIPYNYKDYIDDVTKMRQRGAISAGEQVKSPNSPGSRGLAKVEAFDHVFLRFPFPRNVFVFIN